MRYLIVITVLLGIGYSQCDYSNWQEYYPDMQGCYLAGAILEGAYLGDADLTGALLIGANLIGANLSNANLEQADLFMANLSGANLSCANLTEANLDGVDLFDTTWDDCGNHITDDNGDGYDDASYAAGLLLSTQIVISVTEGWNMISSLPNSVNVDDIQDPNGVIPTNGIYGYEDGSYTAPSVLSPGEGYWLRALGDGDITLNSSNNG